jgi:hypothetical protein
MNAGVGSLAPVAEPGRRTRLVPALIGRYRTLNRVVETVW